ncbi:alpha/beta fold hydrolase [Thiolapillus sp.]
MNTKITKGMVFSVLTLLILLVGACTSEPVQTKREGIVASADGSPIAYGVQGQGQGEPTIVFVHCWTCNHEFWDNQIKHFSQTHRVVWLDLAGHGKSGSHRDRYTMAAFGEDVAAVVEAVGGDKVILVGHSMGGPVAVEAAKRLDDRVVGIVGVDTFFTPFQYPRDQEAINAFVKPFETDFHSTSDKLLRSMFAPGVDPGQIDRIVGMFTGADPKVGVSAMYELFRWNAEHADEDLARFSGILYNINAAPTGKETAPNDHVVMVPGVGHFIAQVKPQAFNQALEGIVAKLTQ